MCGAETIVNYALVIFKKAEVEMKHYLLLILVQSATLSGYTIAAFLTPRVKRKTHFIMGVVLMGISQAICGLALKAEVNAILMFCVSFSWRKINFRTFKMNGLST